MIRPWIRRATLAAAMLGGLVAVLSLTLFFLHRSGFIKGLVNQQLVPFRGLQFFAEDAWIDLWGPTLEVKNFQILSSKSSVPIATIDRASLDVWLNPFRGSLLSPKRVTVESGSVDLPYAAIEEIVRNGSSGKPGGIPSLPEIWVRKLTTRIEPSPRCLLPLGDLAFALSPLAEGGGQLRGRMQLPVGPELLFSGRLDERGTGSFVAAGDLHFEPRNTPETEGPGNFWGDLRPVGDLSLRVQGSFGESVAGGMRLQLDGVAKDLIASIPRTPFRLQKVKGSFSLSSVQESRVDLEGFWEDSGLFLNGKANVDERGLLKFDTFVAAQNLPLDERIRHYATLDPTVAQIWAAFEPKGRCDLALRLHKSAEEEKPTAEPLLRFRGGELTFQGFPEPGVEKPVAFPLPITDLRGEVLCQPGNIALHHLRGKIHGSEISIAGALFRGEGAEGKRLGIDLQLDVPSLPLDETTRRAAERLPAEVASTWDALHLRGAAQMSLRLSKAPGHVPLRLSGRIAPQAVHAMLREFPLPVEDIEGEILLDPERLTGNLRGKAGSGAVEISMALLELRSTRKPALPPLLAKIHATRVPVDEKLQLALETLVPGSNEALRPRSGLVDANIRLARLAENPQNSTTKPAMHRQVRVLFDQLSVEPMWFPLPVDSASGTLLYEAAGNAQGQLALQSVETRALGSPALLRYVASLGQNAGADSFETKLRAFDLPLVPDLFRAMEKAKLPTADIWTKPQWNGAVTVGWDQQKKRELKTNSRLSLSFQDVAFRLPEPAFEMREITGKLELREQGLTAQHFSAKLGNAPVDITELRCPLPAEKPEISFVLSVPRMDLEQDLGSALPQHLATRAKAFGLRGIGSAEEIAVSIELPPGLGPIVTIQGPLTLRHFGTQGVVSLDDGDATLWIQEGRLEGGQMKLRGFLKDGAVTLFRQRIENLQTRFEVSDHAFRVFDASGEAYRGTISQAPETDLLRVELLPPYPFRMNLRFAGIELRRLLRELLPGARNLRGSLGVELQLRGEYADLRKIEGAGSVQIRDGALWEVPVFRDVFKTLAIRKAPVFEKGRFSFRVADQKFSLVPAGNGGPPFELVSKFMDVTAQNGSLDFSGNIDLDLRIKSFSGIPILGELIGFFLSFADFRLTGPIGNPQIAGSASGETPKKLVFVPGAIPEERRVRF